MADSPRTDGSRARAAAGDADRDEKIEQLLLAGLDHYFAARYEHAINVWTRALFLDRSHARAHAYIERGRSALAERQRQSEELLGDGTAALNRGQGYEARRLLKAAVDHGAHAADVAPLLDRLDREPAELVPAIVPAQARPTALSTSLPVTRLARALRQAPRFDAHVGWRSRPSTPLLWASVAAVVTLVASAVVARDGFGGGLYAGPAVPLASGTPPGVHDAPLPLPRRGEMALERARALALRGRLHEALAALDMVHSTDPEQSEADRMRAELQRQLMALVVPARPASLPAVAREKSDKSRGGRP
jgi:tetratricopeptide (TPR) repeat protein